MSEPWRPSRNATLGIGLLSIWPIVYIGLFMATVLFMAGSSGRGGGDNRALFGYVIAVHILTMLLTFVLMVVHLIHLYRTDLVTSNQRVLWLLLILFFNLMVVPIYWYLYWWRPQRDVAIAAVAR